MQHRVSWPSISFSMLLLGMAGLMVAIAFMAIAMRPSSSISSGVMFRLDSRTLAKNQLVQYPVLHDQQLDEIIAKYVNGEVERFEEQATSRGDSRLKLSFTLAHYSDQVATVVFSRYQQTKGEPDIQDTATLILDRQSKRRLSSEDIIIQTPAARLALVRLVYDYIKIRAELVLSPADYVHLLELPLHAINVVRLESSKVIVRVPLGGDMVDISINKRLLTEVLSPTYLADTIDIAPVTSIETPHVIAERLPRPLPGAHDKLLALTFDDGPGDATPLLLDALQLYDSHATFFVLGHLADTYKVPLQRMVSEGHEIGNHSWNHPDLRFQSSFERDRQIMATQQVIQSVTSGYTPRVMRPPYGATDQGLMNYLSEHQLSQVFWTVDTHDWRDRDSEHIYQRIMSLAADGQIVLLHDIYPSSVTAAIRAIRDLKLQGYHLVTVSELQQYR